jgi:hypothetical protein
MPSVLAHIGEYGKRPREHVHPKATIALHIAHIVGAASVLAAPALGSQRRKEPTQSNSTSIGHSRSCR